MVEVKQYNCGGGGGDGGGVNQYNCVGGGGSTIVIKLTT